MHSHDDVSEEAVWNPAMISVPHLLNVVQGVLAEHGEE